MGQAWTGLQNTFKHHIPEEFLNRIIDSVFDSLAKPVDGNNPVTPPPSTSPGTGDKTDTADSPAIPTADEPKKKSVTYEQMHEAIVEVFKKINQIPGANWAGSNWAPPSKESVDQMLKKSDADGNQEIDREEFRRFVREFCRDMMATYAREMMIVTIAVPAVAALTKRATRRVPVVGGLLSKVPNTVFLASASGAALFVRNKFFIKGPGPV